MRKLIFAPHIPYANSTNDSDEYGARMNLDIGDRLRTRRTAVGIINKRLSFQKKLASLDSDQRFSSFSNRKKKQSDATFTIDCLHQQLYHLDFVANRQKMVFYDTRAGASMQHNQSFVYTNKKQVLCCWLKLIFITKVPLLMLIPASDNKTNKKWNKTIIEMSSDKFHDSPKKVWPIKKAVILNWHCHVVIHIRLIWN